MKRSHRILLLILLLLVACGASFIGGCVIGQIAAARVFQDATDNWRYSYSLSDAAILHRILTDIQAGDTNKAIYALAGNIDRLLLEAEPYTNANPRWATLFVSTDWEKLKAERVAYPVRRTSAEKEEKINRMLDHLIE